MAKHELEVIDNPNSYQIESSAPKQQVVEQPKAKGTVMLDKESTWKKVKKAFIADEVTSLKNFAIFDVGIPAIKRTIRDLIVNSLDITLGYGKSKPTSYYQNQNGGKTYVAYGRYANEPEPQERRESRRDTPLIGVMELDRIKFCDIDDFGRVDLLQSKDSAIEALGYLMDLLEDGYDCVTVAQFLAYVSNKVNGIHVAPIHSKWGWYSLQGAAIMECADGSGYYIRFPKPVPM